MSSWKETKRQAKQRAAREAEKAQRAERERQDQERREESRRRAELRNAELAAHPVPPPVPRDALAPAEPIPMRRRFNPLMAMMLMSTLGAHALDAFEDVNKGRGE